MKTNLWRRLATLLAAAVLAGSLALVVPAAAVLAVASDPGCAQLNGDDTTVPGVCQVSLASTPAAAVTVNEPVHLLNGGHVHLTTALSLTVNATGLALEMDKGSSIEGHGKSITINV